MRIDYSVSEIVELTGLTQGSNAVGRLVSGKTVFVGEGVPGDVVEIELIKEAKRHCEAKILRIIEPSAQHSALPLLALSMRCVADAPGCKFLTKDNCLPNAPMWLNS